MRAGETLSSIARRHGMPVSTLAQMNNMGTSDTLVKGQRLVIKASTRRYRDEGAESGRRVLYTVRRGDTVYSISRQFQVSVPQLKSWNGLNEHHQIKAASVWSCTSIRTGNKGRHHGLLSGKRALIVGLATDRSIAWGIAQAHARAGAPSSPFRTSTA